MADPITIESTVNAPIEKVWEMFTNEKYVVKWNQASEDWHTPIASNNLKVGGRFNYRMESKDGSEGFDFDGTYTEVVLNEKISYTMDDPSSHEASNGHSGRKVETIFEDMGTSTKVITTFDPESENPPEFQKAGWQAILDNFKKYAEENK